MSPPATATTELFGEHITDARDTDLGTSNGRLRYLTGELGVTRAQARRLIAAYERDLANARRIGNDTHRSDADFIHWLLRQAPGGRKQPVRKWRVGESGWRTRS